jgi:CBS domain-containing protein
MTRISDIIEDKGGLVLSVGENESVFDAIRLMAEVNIGALLVLSGDTICGIFTERDYLQKIALESRSSHDTQVREVMTREVISAGPEDSIERCMELMTRHRCRHLPVVANGELLGIVSIGDLVKSALEEKEARIEQLSQYISGSY